MYKRRCCSLIPAESDLLPQLHAQTTKTYYKHQDLRIMKAQGLKTKTSANSDIQDLPLRYQVYQGRLLASFQDDAKCSNLDDGCEKQGGGGGFLNPGGRCEECGGGDGFVGPSGQLSMVETCVL
ncbi:hypothetical protein Tco_1087939 [Tanacetum coccineum]